MAPFYVYIYYMNMELLGLWVAGVTSTWQKKKVFQCARLFVKMTAGSQGGRECERVGGGEWVSKKRVRREGAETERMLTATGCMDSVTEASVRLVQASHGAVSVLCRLAVTVWEVRAEQRLRPLSWRGWALTSCHWPGAEATHMNCQESVLECVCVFASTFIPAVLTTNKCFITNGSGAAMIKSYSSSCDSVSVKIVFSVWAKRALQEQWW